MLVNNVGQSARERGSRFAGSTEVVWRAVLEVSLLAAMRLSHLVMPAMLARGAGRIIDITSDAASLTPSGSAAWRCANVGG